MKLVYGVIISLILVVSSAVAANPQDNVRDERGAVVKSTSGGCVLTKWQADNAVCEDQQLSEEESQPATFTSEKSSKAVSIPFGFNSAELSPKASKKLARVIKRAKTKGASAFKLVGHTDLSGAVAYNQQLSQRRVNAVAKAITDAIEGIKIEKSARGELSPSVKTKDGVKEARNRRVEVVFYY